MLDMRPKKGGPDNSTSRYEAERGDIVIVVDGKSVSSGKDITAALHSASVPQDVEVIVKDRQSGKTYRYYVSANAL